MKILLMNDSRVSLKILEDMLKRINPVLEVLTAKDGQEGLEILQRDFEDVCLILTDWNMPRMDGLEFMRVTRKEARLASIPVIMITANAEKSEKINAFQNGIYDLLMKPLDKKLLLLVIKRALEDSRNLVLC